MDPRREFFDFNQFLGNGSLNEILDILCEDEEGSGESPIPESIFIAPSDPAILTDEDSGDEDSGGRAENLNARQLTAGAEVRFEQRYQTYRDTLHFDNLCGRKARTWIDGTLEPFLGSFPEIATDIASQSAVDLFELFIDHDIIDMFILQSNRYALWKNCPDPKITAAEMRCFIAKGAGRPSTSKLADTARFDSINHYVRKCVKKRRCVGPYCKSKSSSVRTECMKCDVGLCIPCFAMYHQK